MFTFSCEFESFEIPNTIAVPNSAGLVSQKVETSTEKIKNGFNQAYTPFVTENDKTETEDVNGQNVLAITNDEKLPNEDCMVLSCEVETNKNNQTSTSSLPNHSILLILLCCQLMMSEIIN